jgi:hypothetical protein
VLCVVRDTQYDIRKTIYDKQKKANQARDSQGPGPCNTDATARAAKQKGTAKRKDDQEGGKRFGLTTAPKHQGATGPGTARFDIHPRYDHHAHHICYLRGQSMRIIFDFPP